MNSWFKSLTRIKGAAVLSRSGHGKISSGLLKGHPAKLLKSSRVKPSGAVFDRQKLTDMYKTKMYCESPLGLFADLPCTHSLGLMLVSAAMMFLCAL